MSYTTNVAHSGMSSQNSQSLKDIQKTELREAANENAKNLIEKNREKNGVSYETTISNAVASGISYIQSMKKQLNGTKFLNDFSKNFRKQQLAQGREIIN